MGNPFKKRIIIVDDHPMMRRGLTTVLESDPGFEVIAQFSRAEDLLHFLDSDEPDLIIADLSLPGINGIELVKNVVFQIPKIKILVVSRHDETLYAERALRAGARGYVMKFESSDTLIKAVRKILAGGIYISEEMNNILLTGVFRGGRDSDSPMNLLSDRELEVFELIGKGKASSEIADQLHLAAKTVETYRSRIKEKLNFNNASELMFHAVKWVEDEGTNSI